MSSTVQPTDKDDTLIYRMPVDQGERQRLDLQHRLVVKLFDGKLSTVPIFLKEGDRVLESGAGSGIWMLELAAQVPPTVQIHGFDITPGLFPTSYPDNVQFTVNSVISLPESWTSSYNFLHQRFLTGGLTKVTWKSATAEMFRVLVKGGWVELVEGAMESFFPCVGPHSTKAGTMMSKSSIERGLVRDPPNHIPQFLSQAGFVNVRAECRMQKVGRAGGEDGIHWVSDWTRILEVIKTPLFNGVADEYVHSEEYDTMLAGAREEWLSCEAEIPFYAFSAQKPT